MDWTERDLTRETERQRTQAEIREQQVRQQAYVSYIWRAGRLWQDDDPISIRDLLRDQWPKANEPDQRGFEWYYLWRLGGKQFDLRRHNLGVEAIWFSADESLCASRSAHQVKVWDIAVATCATTFTKPDF